MSKRVEESKALYRELKNLCYHARDLREKLYDKLDELYREMTQEEIDELDEFLADEMLGH